MDMRISYLEIYNDRGYDLLSQDSKGVGLKRLEDLERVKLLNMDNNNITLKNLSQNSVQSEEEALNLLFTGDTNRVICETPTNDCSTRSHCIFTISIEAREIGENKMRVSKVTSNSYNHVFSLAKYHKSNRF